MKRYRVFFELYGKKMQALVNARSYEDAKNEIRLRITFHKVVLDIEQEEKCNKGLDDLLNILGLK